MSSWFLLVVFYVYCFSLCVGDWPKCEDHPAEPWKPCWGGCSIIPKVNDQCPPYLRVVDQRTNKEIKGCGTFLTIQQYRGLCVRANWDYYMDQGTIDGVTCGCLNNDCKVGDYYYGKFCKVLYTDGCPGGFTSEEISDLLCVVGEQDDTGTYTRRKICKTTKAFKWDTNHYEEIPRVRKSWFEITQGERERYRDAFKALFIAGETTKFVQSHANYVRVYHNRPEFFPYHRVLVYKFETKVRELGGRFADFTLPYWDHANNGWRILNDNVYNQLGGYNTDPNVNHQCVNTGIFQGRANDYVGGEFHYKTTKPTTDWECLIRAPTIDAFHQFPSALDTFNELYSSNTYPTYACSNARCNSHALPHNYIGGIDDSDPDWRKHTPIGQMAHTAYSPDDPIFFLHHCFVDYIYALWQNCHQFEEELPAGITADHYTGSTQTPTPTINTLPAHLRVDPYVRRYAFPGPVGLDYELIYLPITTDTYKVKDVLNLKNSMPNQVQYDKGNFWAAAHVDASVRCTDPQEWFVGGNRRRMNSKEAVASSKPDVCSKDIYGELAKQSKYSDPNKVKDAKLKEQLLHDAAQQECECREDACTLPDTETWMDDCLKMKMIGDGMGERDINISPEQLKKKVVPACMKRMYSQQYDYALENFQLLPLCLGCFSNICKKTPKFIANCNYASNHQTTVEEHHARYSPWNLLDYDESEYYDNVEINNKVKSHLMRKRYSNYRYQNKLNNHRQGRYKRRYKRNRLIN